MEWFIIIYFVMSLIVMDVVKPQRHTSSPILMSIICFLIGGGILIYALIQGSIDKFYKNRSRDEE